MNNFLGCYLDDNTGNFGAKLNILTTGLLSLYSPGTLT